MTNRLKFGKEMTERWRATEQARAQRLAEWEKRLPAPSPWPPADWAPARPEGKAAYAKGYETLAKTPIVFSFSWDFVSGMARGSEVEVSAELIERAKTAPPVLLAAPASCVWRFVEKAQWRSFCAQAASLSGDSLRRALQKFLQPLAFGAYDKGARALQDPESLSLLSSCKEIDRFHLGGFCCGVAIELNPGLGSIAPLKAGEESLSAYGQRVEGAWERLRQIASEAALGLSEDLAAGWILELDVDADKLSGSYDKARLFNYGNESQARELALELCLARWESGEIERGLGPMETSAQKGPRPRI